MKYGQTAISEQMAFLGEEHTTQRKHTSISIYRVSLVRESRLHCYHKLDCCVLLFLRSL